MENFVLYDELGRGEQRVVYKGRRKGTVNYFAIHCVDKSKREDLQNSVRISHNLHQENIVQFFEWYETSNHLWLVVELCTGITLEKILQQDGFLPEETIRKFGINIVEALFYLHSCNILLCDLSPSKIILDGSGCLKLSNFTVAKVDGEHDELDNEPEDADFGLGVSQEEMLSKRLVKSLPFYIAPEVLQGGFHTKQSDIWALGCLLYECFTGRPPYVATQFEELVSIITTSDVPKPVQEHNRSHLESSDDLQSLVKHLLSKDPSKRLCMQDLCMHKFWNGSLSHLLDEEANETMVEDDIRYFEEESRGSFDVQKNIGLVSKNADGLIDSESEQKSDKIGARRIDDSDISDLNASITSIGHGKKSRGNLGKGFATLDLRSAGKISLDTSTSFRRSKENYSQSRESRRKNDIDKSLDQSLMLSKDQNNQEHKDITHFDLNVSFIDLLYHPSDLEVTPIVDNPKVTKQISPKWDAHTVPFSTHRIDKINSYTKNQVEQHIDEIASALMSFSSGNKTADSQTSQKAKLHTLGYLVSIAKNEHVANMMLEKNTTKLLLNDLKGPSQQEVKLRVAKLLGLLACSATYISPNFKMTEVFGALTECLRDNLCVTSLKSMVLPALGEFMFYAATQEEGEDKIISAWEPPGASFTMVSRCLQSSEDVTVQHIAAKIIENIATTAGRYCKKFLVKDVGQNLWSLFSHAVSDAEKLTAISALSRLAMHSNTIFQQVVERVGIEEVLKNLFACSTRIQQPLLTVLISLLQVPTFYKRIAQDSVSIGKFTRILETPSFIVRGKVYLFVAKICGNSQNALLDSCQAKLVTYIERDSRKTLSGNSAKSDVQVLSYLKQCKEKCVSVILEQVPRFLQGIVKAFEAVCGRQHPPSSNLKQLRSSLPNLPVVLHVVTSPLFRPRVVNDNFIDSLGALLRCIQSVDEGQTNISAGLGSTRLEEVIRTTFSIVEAVSQHPPLLLEYREMVIEAMLPSLGAFCSSSSGDNRMLAMKLFADVSSLYLENDECIKSARDTTSDKTGKLLNQMVTEYFLERIDAVLQDQDPIPAYGMRLLHAFIDNCKDVGTLLVDDGMLAKIIDLFEVHQSDTRSTVLVAIVNVIASMVAAKQFDLAPLLKQGIVEYLMTAFIAISSVLEEDTTADHASLLFIPLLDTLRQLLRSLEAQVKRIVRSKEDKRSQSEISKDVAFVEELLKACKVLSELNGILITLLCFDDRDVQDISCQCLYLSAEMFGGEYEECFSDDNLECLSDAIQLFDDKRKKLLLRIVKRFITSNVNLLRELKNNGDDLREYLKQICSSSSSNVLNADVKAVKTIGSEILALIDSN